MTGVASDEGGMFVAMLLWKDMEPDDNKIQDNWGHIGAKELFVKEEEEITADSKLKAEMIAHFYVGRDGVKRENKQELSDMFTDTFFAYPNNEAVKLHAQYKPPVYNYLFTYKGPNTLAGVYTLGNPVAARENFGIVHGDDIFYVLKFVGPDGKPLVSSEDDKKAVQLYQRLILNFARYGDPTPVPNEEVPNWPSAQTSDKHSPYYNINLTPREEDSMFAERMKFWNLIEFKDMLEKYSMETEEIQLMKEAEEPINYCQPKEKWKETGKKQRH